MYSTRVFEPHHFFKPTTKKGSVFDLVGLRHAQ